MSNGPPSRDRRSLQDLAKLASSPSLTPAPPRSASKIPPPAGSGPLSNPLSGPLSGPVSGPMSKPVIDEMEHDSGIVDLKMIAQADEGADARAQSTPLASAPLFDEGDETPARPSSRPASSKSAPPSSAKGLPAAAPSSPATGSGPRARTAAIAAASTAPQPGSSRGFVLGISALLVMGGIGAFVMMRSSAKPEAPSQANAATPSAAPQAATPATPGSAVAAATPPPAASAAADPDPTPAANTDPKAAVAGGHPAVRRGSAAGKPGATGGGGSTVSPLSAMMAEATATAASPPPPSDPGSLGDAVKNAAGGGNGAPAAAADSPAAPHFALGSVAQKPSQGTITSALGSVLPSARSCINPDDPISHAHITFASAGNVSAVSVTGHAAGTPAEGCIKSALLKASVPPFADESYGATVTIRPN